MNIGLEPSAAHKPAFTNDAVKPSVGQVKPVEHSTTRIKINRSGLDIIPHKNCGNCVNPNSSRGIHKELDKVIEIGRKFFIKRITAPSSTATSSTPMDYMPSKPVQDKPSVGFVPYVGPGQFDLLTSDKPIKVTIDNTPIGIVTNGDGKIVKESDRRVICEHGADHASSLDSDSQSDRSQVKFSDLRSSIQSRHRSNPKSDLRLSLKTRTKSKHHTTPKKDLRARLGPKRPRPSTSSKPDTTRDADKTPKSKRPRRKQKHGPRTEEQKAKRREKRRNDRRAVTADALQSMPHVPRLKRTPMSPL